MIKPCTGYTPEVGAKLFFEAAAGGVDIIKDDELIGGDREFNKIEDRVKANMEAARKALEKLQRKNAKKAQREKVRKEKEEERRTKREARKAEREAARQKSEQEQPAEKIIGWWEKIRHKNEKKTESEVKEQMTENIAKDKNESAE